MRAGVLLIAIAMLGWGAACAHRPPKPAETEQLNRSIETLRLQNAAYAKQVEELENRLFILSDQLDSRRVNEERAETPRLPTIALHPGPVPDERLTLPPPGTETAVEPEIEYAGDAMKSSAQRPVLCMHGNSGELSMTGRSREPREASASVRVLRETAPRPGRDEQPEAAALYRKSSEALRSGRHDEAVQGFKELIRAFPAHELADNAQYWLAECFYDRKDYAQAVREFRRVIERYPNGNKVPDALLKVGFSYLALGSPEAGRQTLAQLQRSYPRHEAAVLAASRLADLDHSTPARSPGESARAAAPTVKGATASEEVP
jgi:tol-pal system protein YbgF